MNLLSSYYILALGVFIEILPTFTYSLKIMINFNSTDTVCASKDIKKKSGQFFLSMLLFLQLFLGGPLCFFHMSEHLLISQDVNITM